MIVLPPLPVLEILPALRDALAMRGCAVLEAPPGAGKSPVVPLALLDEPWVAGRKILMLEPRRLAARAVAMLMAATLGERIGETVGYRMRLDTRVGPRTRIEVVTEGVLTRMLQRDASLEGVAAVLFDEFHERSLQADLGLAFCLDAKKTLELDLRLLVMSATLDGAAVAALLDDAPVVTAAGRMYPVEIIYLGKGFPVLPGEADSPERLTALAVQRAAREAEGDILVFLPGAGEIRRVQDMLTGPGECSDRGIEILPLFGELSPEEQERALADDPRLPRRVILATNIAETSLTLPRIKRVVDSGLVRRAVFDPVTGMSRLETRRISRASAEQRAGRAGRVATGRCYRLWSEGAHRSLAAQTPAEIIEADLAPLALDLAQWGAQGAESVRWLDPPPAAMLAAARALLRQLGALRDDGTLTPQGRELGDWPLHPRLAHLLLESAARGEPELGASLAALLSERDLLRSGPRQGAETTRDVDVLTRLDALAGRAPAGAPIDRAALARARRAVDQFMRHLESRPSKKNPLGPAGLLACAYPDRIGRRRTGGEGRYLLANGRGAVFVGATPLARSEFVVALDLDDREREARILLAAVLDRQSLEAAVGERIRHERELHWSSAEQLVVARDVVRLEALVLEEKPLLNLSGDVAVPAMIEGIRVMGLDCLPWDDDARAFCARIELARREELRQARDWPAFDRASLLATLEDWLAPRLTGMTRRAHLAKIPLMETLRFRLGNAASRELDDILPTHIVVPTGSRIRVDYEDDLAPCAAMRMQEVFGLATTPRIGGGAIPITFKLLSPAQRPLQITSDLASFWRNAYTEVRKDMRGRYPRHYWPEDPLQAEPTRRVRPRQ
ncbi:MAG: ATP-dependent helicase HrpB [Gammaproteobacteria bacterium]